MFYLSLLTAFCLLAILVPAEYYNLPVRLTATFIFYFLCLLSGHTTHQDALLHKVQVGTERVGHGGFLADDYYTNDPVYDSSSTWLLIVLGVPVLAVVLLRFFNRQARLHPFIAAGYMFYLWGSFIMPTWLTPW